MQSVPEALDYMREHHMDAAQTAQRAAPGESDGWGAAFFDERLVICPGDRTR
jgi:hypothetical protein